MGLSLFSKDTTYVVETNTTPNPNKFVFEILEIIRGKRYDMLKVKYPHCTTFDGVKILVTRKFAILPSSKELDPHFFEDGDIVARFIPDEEGETLAREMIS